MSHYLELSAIHFQINADIQILFPSSAFLVQVTQFWTLIRTTRLLTYMVGVLISFLEKTFSLTFLG
jgi:hypothetical protein